jgi:hypothetical protein
MKTFITFCAGEKRYHDAAIRLMNQANKIELFDSGKCFTDEDLKEDTEFWDKHSNFIENNNQGFGYWIWKSYIIKKTMETMKNDDILLYLDCGCEIDSRRKDVLLYFFELVKLSNIIATRSPFLEKRFNKMDLIIKLDMVNEIYLNTRQNQAGAILFFVCDKTREFLNDWYELCCDYHNIDNTPSIHENLPCFEEHRHDQSIFSLLYKKYKYYYHPLHFCIQYDRNISGVSKLDD